MTFLIGFLIGGLVTEIWRGLLERREQAWIRPRCWECHRTFSDYRGVYWHHLAAHNDPLSRVLPPKTGAYRE